MERFLNIAHFSDSFYPIVGGRENVIDNLMKELSKKSNTFLLTSTFKGQTHFIEDKDLPYNILRTKSLRITKNEYLTLLSKKIKREIVQKCKRGEIDIIHTHTKYALAKFAIKLGKKYNIPVVTTAHTNYLEQYKHQLKFSFIYKPFLKHVVKIINKTSHCFTVSKHMERLLISLGIKTPITIIPNGNDMSHFNNYNFDEKAVKEKYGLSNSKYIFIFVGRITETKNLTMLINSLEILKTKISNFKVLIVGNGNISYYKNLSNEKGLSENIIFTNAIQDREELASLYKISNLNLQPSNIESFGLTVRESGALGTPSITIKNCATSENINHNKNGFISECSAEDFANNIHLAVSNTEKLSVVGANAKKSFSTSWEDVSNLYLKAYNKIIKER